VEEFLVGDRYTWTNWTIVTTQDDKVHLYNEYTIIRVERSDGGGNGA
jgi:hypothetical protein